MARYAEQARLARERLNKVETEEKFMSDFSNVAPPVARADTPQLIDADGMTYLNIPELRERGDLVAGYDPSKPQATADDQEKIRIERELEIARENAKTAEVARLEAEKKAVEEAEKAKESEELATANARNLEIVQNELERERAENAKALAEMQAKLDAMAKQLAQGGDDEPKGKALKPRKVVKQGKPADEIPDLNIDLEQMDD